MNRAHLDLLRWRFSTILDGTDGGAWLEETQWEETQLMQAAASPSVAGVAQVGSFFLLGCSASANGVRWLPLTGDGDGGGVASPAASGSRGESLDGAVVNAVACSIPSDDRKKMDPVVGGGAPGKLAAI